MKRGIRYIRISKEKQSNFSIDSQEMYTRDYFEKNGIELVDTFIDDGYSAQTFDRPDYTKLETFLKRYFTTVDYLVVNSFDRFSRDAGEALMKIKSLQTKYNISVVSVIEGIIFDKNDPGSFFYTGLLLLKAEDELIRHKNRVNLGIYTAKKKFGRYLGAAPIGYKNEKDDQNKPIITIDEEKAEIVRFIFSAYLKNTPIYIIQQEAKKRGFNQTGHSIIERILKNPAYTSLLRVKGFKELPTEIVEGIHPSIIDRATWNKVQEKIGGKKQHRVLHNENFPLRGVLKCHCGKPLTGAPSKGKSGRRYNYYKCSVASQHNNQAATKIHEQLNDLLYHLILPEHMLNRLRELAEKHIVLQLAESKKLADFNRKEIEKCDKLLHSIEEKYVSNKMNFEAYSRWQTDLIQKKGELQILMDKQSLDLQNVLSLFQDQLCKITDFKHIYAVATVQQKHELINLVFDNKLYYRNECFRTSSLIPMFMQNALILRQRALLIVDG